MNRLTLSIALMMLFTVHAARADTAVSFKFDNDFNCTLNKGYTVPQLYAFQKSWMTEARKHGFGEADYKTRIYFPLYSDVTTTDPLFFVWRGQFADGAVLGRMLDWFPASPWAAKFAQVMNCGKASLWIAPE